MPRVETLISGDASPPDRISELSAVPATPREVVAALEATQASGRAGQFSIVLPVPGGFFGVDDAGRPVILVPVVGGSAPIGRDVGGLSLHYERAVRFDVSESEWTSAVAVITCAERALLPTFCVLALDVASRSASEGTPPSVRRVFEAVGEWERLLRARRLLSADEEIGLWGELWFLAQMADTDAAVAAWQGPTGAVADFVHDGRGLECKTTTQRLRHHVSQTQVERPLGDLDAYVASLWIGEDPAGLSLPELVRRIDTALTEGTVFEGKLLQAGFSRLDAAAYRRRFIQLEVPLVFRVGDVPRVRLWDPGVTGVRFTVQLDDELALAPGEAERLLRGPGGLS